MTWGNMKSKLQKIDAWYIVSVFCLIGLVLRCISLDVCLGFADEYVHYEVTNYVLRDPSKILTFTVVLVHAPLYWCILPVFHTILGPIFGQGIILSRIASIIFGVLFIPVLFVLMKNEFDETTALVSSILASICGYFVILSRIGYPDMFVLVAFAILLFLFMRFYKTPSFKNAIFFGLFLTFNILLKEPTVFLIPAIFIFVVWERDWAIVKSRNFWLALLLPFVLATPIFLYLILTILPKHVEGIHLLNFYAFYQSALGRGLYVSNIVPGVIRAVHNFTAYSSMPMTLLFLFGVGYAFYKRGTTDKFFLSTFIVFLAFLASVGGAPIPLSQYGSIFFNLEFPQYDWHLKWAILPVLILTATSLVDFYRQKIRGRVKDSIKLVLLVLILIFMVYILSFDVTVIGKYNMYMMEHFRLIPLSHGF